MTLIMRAMEKIFQFTPGPNGPERNEEKEGERPAVSLRSQHLHIAAGVAGNAFGEAQQVYAVYYANLGMLLLAPDSDQMFRQAHDCSMIMLKTVNPAGDRSLSLQEIIIDHDLDDTDRRLDYTAAPGLRMLQVKL